MIPELPSNPWTITPLVSTRKAQELMSSINDDLRRLRQFDTYHRSTDPEREAAKASLEALKSKLTTK